MATGLCPSNRRTVKQSLASKLSQTTNISHSTFLSEQINHQQPANNTFLSEQTSTRHQPNEQADRFSRADLGSYKPTTIILQNTVIWIMHIYPLPSLLNKVTRSAR
jgi:hypothetical protein